MIPDLPPLPPDARRQSPRVRSGRRTAEPLVVESNGYRYTVSGNMLPPVGDHRREP